MIEVTCVSDGAHQNARNGESNARKGMGRNQIGRSQNKVAPDEDYYGLLVEGQKRLASGLAGNGRAAGLYPDDRVLK